MPISLTYIGDPKYTEIAEATRIAHEFLQGQAIVQLIEARDRPFDDAMPADLSPAQIAGYVRDETFTLSVRNYRDRKGRSSIGGRFRPKYPDQIEINVLALPRRPACEFAGVLIHESIHALSRRIRKQTDGEVHFSHTPNGREGNENTAPYWIQTQAEKQVCGKTTLAFANKKPLIIEHEEE